jgi:hypothetical protein
MPLGVVAVDVEVEFGVELVERGISRLAADSPVVSVAVDPVAVVVVVGRIEVVVRPSGSANGPSTTAPR